MPHTERLVFVSHVLAHLTPATALRILGGSEEEEDSSSAFERVMGVMLVTWRQLQLLVSMRDVVVDAAQDDHSPVDEGDIMRRRGAP